jgi:hypothetical protein
LDDYPVRVAAIIVGLILLAICLLWTIQYFSRRRY